MDVRNCKNCGKMFNYIGKTLCAGCEAALEDKFAQVKKYVRENPQASINVVAAENEVSVTQIKRWVRQERLAFADDSLVGLECESCGTMIRTGKYCESCKQNLSAGLSSMIKKEPKVTAVPEKKTSARMRYLDR